MNNRKISLHDIVASKFFKLKKRMEQDCKSARLLMIKSKRDVEYCKDML